MSLKPDGEKLRKRDQFLGYVRKRVFRSSSPSMPPSEFHVPSTSSQSLVQPEDVPISSQVHSSQDEPSSTSIRAPVDYQAGFVNKGNHDSPSAVSQPAQRYQLHNDPAKLGTRSSPPSPINVPINHQDTGSRGKIAIEVVKESLKLVARISDVFPPLKTAVAGLVEIFDRIDAINNVQIEAAHLHEQVEKLVRMLETYQNELPPSAKDRLDGLHRTLEEKRVALENKLERSLATRIVFSTEDTQFMVQVLREITFSIEVTTFDMTLSSNLEILKMSDNTSKMSNKFSKMSGSISHINDNAVLDKLGHIVGAEFNREDRQGCTLGTRVSLLADLLSWATAEDSPHVFWLNGMAGTGKTTVMETFCSLLNEKGLLGSSFFCSIKSKAPRRDVRVILPSIAKMLAGNHPRFRENLLEVLTKSLDPLGIDLADQYHTLIVGPAEAAFRKDEIILIAIDALDECEDQEGTEMFLNAILDRKPNVPLRFFVTSRPERRIREAFEQRCHFSLRLHDIEHHVVQADIAIFLNDQLRRVRKLRQYYGSSWPPSEIGIIAERAGKLFIYASTILKYITDRGDPCERLRKMTALRSPVAVAIENMEKLYTFILSEAFTGIDNEEASCIWSCLSILVSAQHPLSVSTYAKILETKAGLIRTALESLHSVIIVPDADDQYISICHASFPDYLATHTGMWTAHNENATRCFRFMNSELRLGISGLTTSHRSNDDQPKALLPAHLKYTCTAWGYLVLQLIGPSDLLVEDIQTQIEAFLRSKFLYWLEVLSAMGDVPYASRILYQLSQKVPASQSLKPILTDFLKFTNTFRHPIRSCAPHIYLSALPFASPTSMVSKLFLPKFPSLPIVHRSTDNTHVQHSILLFEGHKGSVNCVAFSPDGKYIVSGSDDCTVRLWNIETGGAACKPFEGHEYWVHSVAFSPDGKYIASGSMDTIRLWNVETGKATLKQFEEDIVVKSLLFTPNGKYIISVSTNHTIQLWNINTGKTVLKLLEEKNNYVGKMAPKPIEGQDDYDVDVDDVDDDDANVVVGVAFSPNGKYIALQGLDSWDIQLWNIETGKAILKPFEGHTDLIICLSFSPDGKYIVSGSKDCTIRLWDIETGKAALKPIEGHKSYVQSIAFSPDGKYIVSGSYDCTVRLWNAKNGEAASKPLEGHTNGVVSASFSPDGKYIVTGSHDRTIRLWNVEADIVVLRPFEGHTGSITSISFSPDGKHLASGSKDRTIRLWNVRTGEAALKPFEGHANSVTSVSFSPDGEYIASGSWDCTTRLWNAKTGELEVALTPLEGHSGTVTSVSFSPDGKYISSVSAGTIQLWTIKTGEIALGPFGKDAGSVLFSSDGKHIASRSLDGTIQLWDIEMGEAVFKQFQVYQDGIWCVAFSPDGKYLVAGSQYGEVRLWNVETGEAAWGSSEEHDNAIISVAFSPDGKHITCGSHRTIQLWTVETDGPASKPLELEGHQDWVSSVSFSPDGKYIASGSRDSTIRIYNHDLTKQIRYDLRRPQTTFLHQYPIGSVMTGSARREGWLQYPSGDLMLWVPPELHLGLYLPGVVHVIGADGIKIELSQFVHGTEWLKCQEQRSTL